MDSIIPKTTIGDLMDPVPARLVGPFAIHRDLHSFGRWTLTHVRTGFAVASGLMLEESADRIAAAIHTLADWDFDTPTTLDEWDKARRAQIRGLVRRMQRDDELRARDIA